MTAAASSTEGQPAQIVAEARSWIGTPYHHQASVKGVGCDCIGLVRGVWRAVIGPEPEAMPAYSRDWGEAAGAESLLALGRRYFTPVPVEAMAPGDVVVFRMREGRIAKHCGILTAHPNSGFPEFGSKNHKSGTPDLWRFVHAQERVPVAEVAMSDWWRRRVVGAFRFPAPVVIAGPGCCAAHQRCAAGPGDPAIHSLAVERGASRHGMGSGRRCAPPEDDGEGGIDGDPCPHRGGGRGVERARPRRAGDDGARPRRGDRRAADRPGAVRAGRAT